VPAATELATLRGRFADFARTCADLPLYGAVSRAVSEDDRCAALLQAAMAGQDRPVLWFAALHDLVLRRREVPAARWYASVVGRDHLPSGDPWPDVRQTVLDHADELRSLIATRTTQTNEVNRSVYLAPALALACADIPDRPVVLLEMGASAGLLLDVDRYRTELIGPDDAVLLGDPASPVRCSGQDRSARPLSRRSPAVALPRVVDRHGIDRHPVDLTDVDAVRWLEACLWPDVPGRVERFRSAVELVSREETDRVGGVVVPGDMVDDLPVMVTAARRREPGAHLVVFSSWALTYVERSRRLGVASALDAAARDGHPLTWLTAEPPRCAPGVGAPEPAATDAGQTTVLATRSWRRGVEAAPAVLGTAHPHGEWVSLDAGP
jgi:hypothetical protein